ncbi:hypothetical protein CMI47_17015 [Candidatus Pacearchaeota archaeon]|nr:hypothetical protein [Candidatus Pacearchaeota archaeon]|tara:strand:+ start:13274 stop:13954 length:681 start_codon:yes stop_codon:yes gene_type:complete
MSFENCYFLIPARKGSKGFPFKNRMLFEHAAKTIPEEYRKLLYVSTNDEFIKEKADSLNIKVVERPEEIAQDTTSMKAVMKHFVDSQHIGCNATIIMLYLTYPERTWADIQTIYNYYCTRAEKSLLCCEDVIEHPYLAFYEKEHQKATLVVDHALYRRQDYPQCIRLSMFVACYKVDIIDELHDLMFEPNSVFYKLNHHKIDVDYRADLETFQALLNEKDIINVKS